MKRAKNIFNRRALFVGLGIALCAVSSVAVAKYARGYGYVRLSYVDQGIGISSKLQCTNFSNTGDAKIVGALGVYNDSAPSNTYMKNRMQVSKSDNGWFFVIYDRTRGWSNYSFTQYWSSWPTPMTHQRYAGLVGETWKKYGGQVTELEPVSLFVNCKTI